jgi:biopolymer transport protein TolR
MFHRSMELPTTVAKINVTPIIDVALVLVIILLITAPMLQVSDLGLNLPQAQTRSIEDEVSLSITLASGGETAIDEDIIPPGRLGIELQERLAAADGKDLLVVVRADESIPYASVRRALRLAREAGARRLAIATRHVGKESS